MSAGDRPALPLAAEPFLQLVAPATGTVQPRGPVFSGGPFALDEEPALWPRVRAGTARDRRDGADPAPTRTVSESDPVRAAGLGRLPATGLTTPPAVGVGLLALAALVRLRRRGS